MNEKKYDLKKVSSIVFGIVLAVFLLVDWLAWDQISTALQQRQFLK